jgi:hypothetical protein
MAYGRTAAQRATDMEASKGIEEQVALALGEFFHSNTESTEKLDFWVPGFFVEVKAKNQKISARWPTPWPEADCFILDELSIRKAMEHYPHAYFVLHDRPGDRWFVARVDQVALADRVRLNRSGNTGHRKGKWVVNLADFQQITLGDLLPWLMKDQLGMGWKASECVGAEPALTL